MYAVLVKEKGRWEIHSLNLTFDEALKVAGELRYNGSLPNVVKQPIKIGRRGWE